MAVWRFIPIPVALQYASAFEFTRLRFAYSFRRPKIHRDADGSLPRRQSYRISNRMVDALFADGKHLVFWDRGLPGLGVRLYCMGRKTYLVQSRGPNGSSRLQRNQNESFNCR